MRTTRLLPFLALSTVLLLSACKKPAILSGGTGGEENQGTTNVTMNELMKRGKDYTCDFTTAETSGKIYIAGKDKKMRGDFTGKDAKGMTTTSSMIRADGMVYVWSPSEGKGMMMTEPAEGAPVAPAAVPRSPTGQPTVSDNVAMDFTCAAWDPDASMFMKPTNIEFMDMSAQMKQMQEMMQNKQNTPQQEGTSAPAVTAPGAPTCATCDSVPESARRACKQALKCP